LNFTIKNTKLVNAKNVFDLPWVMSKEAGLTVDVFLCAIIVPVGIGNQYYI
jgi:hypothetical protein